MICRTVTSLPSSMGLAEESTFPRKAVTVSASSRAILASSRSREARRKPREVPRAPATRAAAMSDPAITGARWRLTNLRRR